MVHSRSARSLATALVVSIVLALSAGTALAAPATDGGGVGHWLATTFDRLVSAVIGGWEGLFASALLDRAEAKERRPAPASIDRDPASGPIRSGNCDAGTMLDPNGNPCRP
jgi:hypothetical protein